MGTFHANLQVHGAPRASVLEAVRLAGLKPAYLLGQLPWLGVCAELLDSQDTELLEAACRNLSGRLQARVFGFLVHDSDVLLYFLYEGGRRRDAYVSRPGYFSGERLPPSGGDVDVLLGVALPGTTEGQLRHLLHALRTTGQTGGRRASLPDGLRGWRRVAAQALVWLFTRAAGPPAEELLAELAALLGIPQAQVLSNFRDVHEDASHPGEAV